MGRIVVSENVSLDGVVQDPTGEEGFEFGGWFNRMPEQDRTEWGAFEYEEALDTAAWLVGRGTYTWFEKRWGDRPGAWADRLREVPKYVVSSTLESPTGWGPTTVLRGDLADEVTGLQERVDGDVVVYGSAPLAQALLAGDLVDELRLTVHPFVLGSGARMYGLTDAPRALERVAVRTFGSTLVHLTYQRAGTGE
ncbi:MAG TPA: dihydrofolate reductase family protein [Lapillicoccus sp.]|nr:dihydrofolate reductase family protein [Lapillicoccus sp.]